MRKLSGVILLLGVLAFVSPFRAPETRAADVEPTTAVGLCFRFEAKDPTLNTLNFFQSPEVFVTPQDYHLRLVSSVLIADEIGATDHHQTEALSDLTRAKKIIRLDAAHAGDAELYFYGGAGRIELNGKPLPKEEKLFSTGWKQVAIPRDLLKAGDNEFVLFGSGSLLVEPNKGPGRSFKSSDGGKTWAKDNLTSKGNVQGEYLCRLRLRGSHPARGWAMSQAIDLWRNGNDVPRPSKLFNIEGMAALGEKQPKDTSLKVSVRTGPTPTPDDKTWTGWVSLDKDLTPEKPAHRWAQLRFELATTNPGFTPAVPASFDFRYKLERAPVAEGKLTVNASGQPFPRRTSVPFVYESPSPRLKLLREKYQLDKVIAPGKTELEQLVLLRHWVRHQWHTAWQGGAACWMPPWDALIILDCKDQKDCLTMCTHYGCVYTQGCLALGWNARHCILDHHCVSEVYVNQFQKWVMMDAGNSAQRADVNLHFERNGVPLSAMELLQTYNSGKKDVTVCFTPAKLAEQIADLCRPAPPPGEKKKNKDFGPMPRPDTCPLEELTKYPVCQLQNYRRYAFPPRNNYLASLYPGELYQGWSSYFYDGYCWVGDFPNNPVISPEYSLNLSPNYRPQDIDWHVNWTRAHLARTAKANELQVTLETFTPNLSRLEIATEEGAAATWKKTPAEFAWTLKLGKNVLRMRSVNQFERVGAESMLVVDNGP